MEGGTEFKVHWYREYTTNTAVRNKMWPKPATNEMFPSWVNRIKTGGGNGTKRPKICPSDSTTYRDRLSTVVILLVRET